MNWRFLAACFLLVPTCATATPGHPGMHQKICDSGRAFRYGEVARSIKSAELPFVWRILDSEADAACWLNAAAVLGMAESPASLSRFQAHLKKTPPIEPSNRSIKTAVRLLRALGDLVEVARRNGQPAGQVRAFLEHASHKRYWMEAQVPLVATASERSLSYSPEKAAQALAGGAQRALKIVAYYERLHSLLK